MLFSSLTFLIWFLPATLLLHMLAPHRMKNALLLLLSVLFYAWGEVRYVPFILLSMLLNYLLALGCVHSKRGIRHAAFVGSLLLNMGALVYFKYAAFFMTTIGLASFAPRVSLPLGISFYTFQTQAYVIDVYRRRVPPERNIVSFATFLLLFPQLIAGPIVLYTDIRRELKRRTVSAAMLEDGMVIFIAGLAAKVLLANPLGALWEQMHSLEGMSTPAAWLGICAFGLQIYFDFAGYSWMAIGIGRMLGFRFPKNFNQPYASRSIQEFWRRWHMTLGGWFREYVYIPLGGSRGTSAATVRNLFIVWFLTGLWHGASWNFVVWGLWFFVFLLLERFCIGRWLRRHRGAGLLYTLLVVFIGWVLFANDSLPAAFAYLHRMFILSPGQDWIFALAGNAVLLIAAIAACLPPVWRIVKATLARHRVLRAALMVATLCLCIAALVNAAYNPFLYFRF